MSFILPSTHCRPTRLAPDLLRYASQTADAFVGTTLRANGRHEYSEGARPRRRRNIHLAFEIPLEQYAAERERLQARGLEVRERTWSSDYAWLRARSLFFDDPEGNTIELIAHDPTAENMRPG